MHFGGAGLCSLTEQVLWHMLVNITLVTITLYIRLLLRWVLVNGVLAWGPYGPLWTLMGPYGPLWALMGPYGPIWAHMGPIWVLLDRSGHDQSTTFGPMLHVLDSKLGFRRNLYMILHGFCRRSSKTMFFQPKNLMFY